MCKKFFFLGGRFEKILRNKVHGFSFLKEKVWVLRKIPLFFMKRSISFWKFSHSKDFCFLKKFQCSKRKRFKKKTFFFQQAWFFGFKGNGKEESFSAFLEKTFLRKKHFFFLKERFKWIFFLKFQTRLHFRKTKQLLENKGKRTFWKPFP